jgi:hypothetical protein
VASEDLTAIHGSRRMMAVSRGEVRSMDRPGVVLPFAKRARTGDARL